MSNRTVIVTPVGGAWRERALEAEAHLRELEAENRTLYAERAALRRRLRRRWCKAATKRWFEAGLDAASERDGKRHRGHDVKVPLTLVAQVEAEGVYKGSKLAAEVAHRTHAEVRTGYRALKGWREFKASGLVFLIELDEHGRLVVTTDETKSLPLIR